MFHGQRVGGIAIDDLFGAAVSECHRTGEVLGAGQRDDDDIGHW